MEKIAVAVKEEKGIALTATQLAINAVLVDNASSGFEEADQSSFALPFISILQALSPQCKKKDPAYIEGAEEGMFFNSVEGTITDGDIGVDFVPVYFAQRYIAWGLRDKGGGFKGEYPPSDPIVHNTTRDPEGRDILNSNLDVQLVDTRVHYGLLKVGDAYQPAVFSMSSTQVKKSKQWMSRMQAIRITNANGGQVQAPMFSRIWHLTTVSEGNDKGTWMGFKIGDSRQIEDQELLYQAMALKEAIQSGLAKASYQAPEAADEEKF